MVYIKRKIITGIGIVACVALCAAVWPRSAEVGDLPAETVKTALTAEIEARPEEIASIIFSADTHPPEPETVAENKPPETEAITAEEKTETPPPATPKPSAQPSSNPKSGDKAIIDDKPYIWIPGFEWIEDHRGESAGTFAADMYEYGNKIGVMGGGTTVGNPGDELTGNKVGQMGGTTVGRKGDINKQVGVMGGEEPPKDDTNSSTSEQAVQDTGAKLIVLDPLQAYLGDNVDMHRANEVRPIFKRLCAMADRTGCAIILIGHMNKAQGLISSYRGLGSIDFRAAARSMLLVGRLKSDPSVRVVAHDKSSLAPEGKSIAFSLDVENGFQWIGYCDISVDDVLSGTGSVQTKTALMEDEAIRMLTKPVPAEEVFKHTAELGISERTVKIAKKNLNVQTEKLGGQWFWRPLGSRV